MSSVGSLENVSVHENNSLMEGVEPFEASKQLNTELNQTIPISAATSGSDNSNGIQNHKPKHGDSHGRHKDVEELTPEQKAAKEAEDKRIEALRQALNAALKKQREDFESQMPKMPELLFGGRLVFVKTAEDDASACKELNQCGVIGVDFEWKPDFQKDRRNQLSIVQVCSGYRCYIWCLYQYKHVPKALHRLLLNPNILKVGCGMRGSDLEKLHLSGLGVSPPIVKTKTRHGLTTSKQSFDLPHHFIDVQDFKLGEKRDTPLPFKGLNHLTALFLRHNAPNNLNPTKAQWFRIEEQTRLQEYSIADCYAVFLIWLRYHGHEDLFETLIERDDHFIEQVLLRNRIIDQVGLDSFSSLSPSADRPHFLDYTHIPSSRIPAPADSVQPIRMSFDYSSPRRLYTHQRYGQLIQTFKRKNYRNQIGDDASIALDLGTHLKNLSAKLQSAAPALAQPASPSTSQGGLNLTQATPTASSSNETTAPQIQSDSQSAQPPNSPTIQTKDSDHFEKATHPQGMGPRGGRKHKQQQNHAVAPSVVSEAPSQRDPNKLSRRQKNKLKLQRRQEEQMAAYQNESESAMSSTVPAFTHEENVKPATSSQTAAPSEQTQAKGPNAPAITRLKAAHFSTPPKIAKPIYKVVVVPNADKPEQPVYKCELKIGDRVFHGASGSQQSAKTAAAKRACAAFKL